MLESSYFIGRLILAGVLLLAAAAKLGNLRGFAVGIEAYGLIPKRHSRLAARSVVAAEAVLGTAFLADFAPTATSVATCGLFGLFTWVIGRSLAHGKRQPCHCFGGDETEPLSVFTLARVVLLLAGAVSVLALSRTTPAPPSSDEVLPSVIVAVLAIAVFRLFGIMPTVVMFFRTKPRLRPVPTSRVSFRYVPLDLPMVADS